MVTGVRLWILRTGMFPNVDNGGNRLVDARWDVVLLTQLDYFVAEDFHFRFAPGLNVLQHRGLAPGGKGIQEIIPA